ncbi:hypothetical protein E5E70_02540 [Helicobacter pylori]|uniref:hypothetical protein n=1 Tax=Helicobacter pylori TaxID=210 RepID=UPI000EAD6529|nr:hypothetical protein [Helicobacter pylori]WRD55169.1 hypothetical protein E5E70_02540 [Helicobacter pylori]WRD87457.1 hypothetical protein E5E83_04265 [Helicobacter pylori]
MQLFEKWQSATEAYNSFYEEAEHLGLEVVTFLKHFSKANDTFKNAIFKMFDSESECFSILVKTAESTEDYPLVFRFKNDSGEVWEFIVRDKQEQNKTIHDFLEECESKGKTHLLEKQIERAEQCLSLVRSELVNFDAYLIIQYLIVELLKNGGFDD